MRRREDCLLRMFFSSSTNDVVKVRTDPLVFSQTGPCLSDHVHRFYGAVSPRTMRPEVTFADLRAATGNTGNVEENKSLYWNPVIYKVMDNILTIRWTHRIAQCVF